MAGKEKRVCARFTIRDAKVGLATRTIMSLFKGAPKGYLPLMDISMRGVRLLSKDDFDEGQILNLTIDVPATPELVKAKARVVWTRQYPKTDKFELAAEFVKISPASLTIISKLEDQVHLRNRGRDGVHRI
ncbi:MAG: PilZ domain-containing protein [Planctomycetota bacterium]